MPHFWAFGNDATRILRPWRAIIAGACLTVSAGCSAPIGAAPTAVEFLCTVDGAKMLVPGVTDASICATFKQRVDAALPKATKSVQSASAAEWIKVEVRFVKPASATAVVTRKNAAGKKIYPVIAVDVMDKPLGDREVKMLADQVAKLVSAKG